MWEKKKMKMKRMGGAIAAGHLIYTPPTHTHTPKYESGSTSYYS
jgi:hypothetical protein